MANTTEIEEYLAQLFSSKIIIIPTTKNRETKLLLGIDDEGLEVVVRALKPKHYHQGPVPDDNPNFSGNVWKFYITAYDEDFYVKIKEVDFSTEKPTSRVLSCHIEHIEKYIGGQE